MNENPNDLLIVPCSPYPEFLTPLEDQSPSELMICPECKNKMWISEKKKALFTNLYSNKDILLACYNCLVIYAKKNPDAFAQATLLGYKNE